MIYQYAINISGITNISQIKSFMNDLSQERLIRVHKYYFEKDKIRCVIAEALLRYALWKKFGMRNNEIKFDYSQYGKPFLASGENIFFNLSHSGDWVVCAVGDFPIGVDVEKIEGISLPDVYKFFSKNEIQLLQATAKDNQVDLFFRIWTLKESFVKNIGKGLNCPFNKFSFGFYNNKINMFQNDNINYDMNFLSTKLDENHWYALCSKCNEKEVPDTIEIITLKNLIIE